MDEEDQYVAQLREVFDTCDTRGSGRLHREQLVELCEKLQLEGQSDALIRHLLDGDNGAEVDFEAFKEGFVAILANDPEYSVVDGIPSESEDDASVSISLQQELEDEVSPKYIRNGRRYGRRSRPEIDHSVAYSEIETEHSVRKSRHSLSEGFIQKDSDRDLLDDAEDFEVDTPSMTIEFQDHETFVGDGELNAFMGTHESPGGEIEQMQKVWNDVGVGQDGYLDIEELAIVCEHIGMEDMDKDELQNLFNKLDEDGDGRVSFDDFVQGLFKHEEASTSPAMSPPKLVRMIDDRYHRSATPTFIFGMQNLKLFTSIDPENSGFANVDEVIEYWQSLGIQNPLEVLEALDTDMEAGKINLKELSSMLEQVLMTTADDNDVFQAAVSTFQGELKHIRAQVEYIEGERDKLRADLTDAQQQSAAMLQEVDERHMNIEKNHEAKLKSVEKKYKEKISNLQSELAMDRETLTSHAVNQRQDLEDELEALRAEESQLRTRVEILEKENERLDNENEKAAESLIESQKTIQKQQRDLEGFQELEDRLAGLESNTDMISRQQVENYEDAIRDYQELLRKERDKVDELTQETELLKHQSSTTRKARKKGMIKPQRRAHPLLDSENDSEFDEMLLEDRAGGDGNSNTEEEMKKIDAEVAKWEAKVEYMKEEHEEQLAQAKDTLEREMEQAKANFEAEFGEMEERYKVKIIEMEDDFEKERKRLREEVDNEKEGINNQLTELENVLEAEREGLREKFENEKQAVKNKADLEKEELRKELEGHFQSKLERQLQELEEKLAKEKEKEMTALEKEIAKERRESENKIKSLQKELELKLKNSKAEMEGFYKKERDELEVKLQEKVEEMDNILHDGVSGLQGQLKEDFQELLQRHKEELEENFRQEKELLEEQLEKERAELQEQFEQEKSELTSSVGSEKDEVFKRMKKEKEEMIQKFKKDKRAMEEKFQAEKLKLSEKHDKDKELLRKELEKDKKKLGQELQKDKDKTTKQLSKEKAELEKQLQKEREKYKTEREAMEAKFALELEALRENHEAEREEMERSLREKEIEEEFQRSAQLNHEKAELERQLQQEREEYEAKKQVMEGEFAQELQRLKEKHQAEKDDVEREQTAKMQATEEQFALELEALKECFQVQMADMERQKETDMQALRETFARELETLNGNHQAAKGVMDIEKEAEMQEFKEKIAQEMDALKENYQTQIEDMEKVHLAALQNYEEELAQVRRELEHEKAEFDTDRKELELQLRAAEVAKEEAMTAVTIQHQQSAPDMEVKNPVHDELSHKNSLLEMNVSRLEEKLGEAGEKLEHSKNAKDMMEKKIDALKSERDKLKSDMDSANRKLMELQMKVTISDSQHSRELQRVKAAQQEELMAGMEKLQQEIHEMEGRLKEAQAVIREKEGEMERQAVVLRESDEMKDMKRQKEEVERRYKKTRGLLNEYMKKLKEQMSRSTRSDILVKDLYIENSKLQKALQLTEDRQKRAERSSINLVEKNHAYLSLLKKICPAAV